MKVVVLAGGLGGSRFARALAETIDPQELTIVGNVGDDVEVFGLHVSPDLDTILYTLTGRLDEEREPPFGKWRGSRATVRDRLIHSISHTAEHVGHAQLARDLYNARRGST